MRSRSPFALFRKHQKVLMVVLTLLAVFAFVFLDAADASGGQMPVSLLAIIGASAGALIFWLLGSSGGRGTEWAITGALVGALAIILVPRFFAQPGAVSTSVGSLSDEELLDLMRRRRVANDFVRDVFVVGRPYPERLADHSPELAAEEQTPFGQYFLGMVREQWGRLLTSYQFGPPVQQHVLTTWLLAHEADNLGVVVSNDQIRAYLVQVSNGKLRGQDLTRLRKDHGLSESQLYGILRSELKAARAAELLQPELLATPTEYWDLYRRFNVRQELTLTAVPVERFVDREVQPSRTELLDFFEQHKERFAENGEPGFRQPRKIQFAYIEADFETVRNRMFPDEITESELREHYEANRELYRNPTYEAPGSPGTGPALTPPGAQPPPHPEPPAVQPPGGEPADPAAEGAETTTPPSTDAQPPAEGDESGDGQAGVFPGRDLSEVAFIAQDQPAEAEAEPAAAENQTPAVEADPADAAPAEGAAESPPDAPGAAARPLPLPPPLPEDPVSEYLPFEEVRERIQSRLEDQRNEQVRRELDRLIQRAGDRMSELGRAHRSPAPGREPLSAAEVSARLQEYAQQNGLRYVVTDLLSHQELAAESVGQMIDVAASPFDDVPPLADQIFNSGTDAVYIRLPWKDPVTENRIVGWKVRDVPSHVPQFTDEGIEQQVLEAWRIAQARPRAETRAEEFARLVREHPERDLEQALAGQTLTGDPGGLEPTVRTTRPFTWFRTSTAPQPGRLGGTRFEGLSPIDGVEMAGNAFMETVFNELDEGDVAVVPNADKSVYYVVKVVSRSTSNEITRSQLYADLLRAPLFEDQSHYPQLMGTLQRDLWQAWGRRLWDRYNVQWHQPLDEDMAAEF